MFYLKACIQKYTYSHNIQVCLLYNCVDFCNVYTTENK